MIDFYLIVNHKLHYLIGNTVLPHIDETGIAGNNRVDVALYNDHMITQGNTEWCVLSIIESRYYLIFISGDLVYNKIDVNDMVDCRKITYMIFMRRSRMGRSIRHNTHCGEIRGQECNGNCANNCIMRDAVMLVTNGENTVSFFIQDGLVSNMKSYRTGSISDKITSVVYKDGNDATILFITSCMISGVLSRIAYMIRMTSGDDIHVAGNAPSIAKSVYDLNHIEHRCLRFFPHPNLGNRCSMEITNDVLSIGYRDRNYMRHGSIYLVIRYVSSFSSAVRNKFIYISEGALYLFAMGVSEHENDTINYSVSTIEVDHKGLRIPSSRVTPLDI